MKQYVLTMYQPDGPPPPEVDLEQMRRELDAITADMRDAGAWVFSGGLHPASTATVVRARDGGTVTTDGPYVEGKEHMGGFTIVNAPDLDSALGWAAKLARVATLPVEVRPFQERER
jgi:hypothetical protein